MENKILSLIYPNDSIPVGNLIMDNEARKSLLKNNYLYNNEVDLTNFLTDDLDTLKYRHEIFSDLLNNSTLVTLIDDLIPMLDTINELFRIRERYHDTESQVFAINEIIIYIEFIEKIHAKLKKCENHIFSKSLLNFSYIIDSITEDRWYINLKSNTEKLSKDISAVKSVTIGFNIDTSFKLYEAGILSFNSEYIRSYDLIERLLNTDIKKDKYQAISPIKVTSKLFSKEEKEFATMAVNSAMNKVFKSSIKEWQPAIKAFFTEKTRMFLPLIPELKFLSFGIKVLRELKAKNLPLCSPVLKQKSDKSFFVKGIYNPIISINSEKIVFNDITFDKDGMIYILTGPNSGGKSVFTCAVGICQVFAQLGLLVPAKYAEISPVEKIFVHFANKSISNQKGRLGEECEHLKIIFDQLTEHSLVLLDETLSSTGSYEGAFIAADIISALSAYGCRGIYTTHLHEILNKIPDINNLPASKSKVDTLAAGIESSGERSYKITRTMPAGKSFARDISESYGLSYEKIIQKLK